MRLRRMLIGFALVLSIAECSGGAALEQLMGFERQPLNCYNHVGAVNLAINYSSKAITTLEECADWCTKSPCCECFTYNGQERTCFPRGDCNASECMFDNTSGYETWFGDTRKNCSSANETAVLESPFPGYLEWPHRNCFHKHGADELPYRLQNRDKLDTPAFLETCKQDCDSDEECDCFVFFGSYDGECWLRQNCNFTACQTGPLGVESYFFTTFKKLQLPDTSTTELKTMFHRIAGSGMIGFPVIFVLASLFLIFVACLVARCRSKRTNHKSSASDHSSESDAESTSDVEASPGSPSPVALNAHYYITPSRWCITPPQLKDFLKELEAHYPDHDPDAYAVVHSMVVPITRDSGKSYALMLNPDGVQVKHFVTHAWSEGVKEFCRQLLSRADGGLWICFLANPQTWEAQKLGKLLGTNPYLSPFYSALREAEDVIAVRNPRAQMYSRLWCVFELFAAHKLDKMVYATGSNPPGEGDLSVVGMNATCSNRDDARMLRAAIEARGEEEEITSYVSSVIAANDIALQRIST